MHFFRKIRQTLLQQGKVRSYFTYAVGEILLVMIGILLALQVDKCRETDMNRQEELIYYENLKEELRDQQRDLLGNMRYNERHLAQFKYALEIATTNDQSKADTLRRIIPNLFNYSDFDQKGNIYEVLINSGDLKLLTNIEIINGIRDMEERYLYLNRMESIHWDVIIRHIAPGLAAKFSFSDLQPLSSETLYSFEFENLYVLLIRIMEEKKWIYKEAIEIKPSASIAGD